MSKYPRNWPRASRTLRRVIGHCELCGSTEALTVHHRGAPLADGRPGRKEDKHDLRWPENLQVLCWPCHEAIDHLRIVRSKRARKQRRRQAKLEQHRALGIGTGLVLVRSME